MSELVVNSIFSNSLQFFDLRRKKFVDFLARYVFIFVLIFWGALAWFSPMKLKGLYSDDTNINGVFLNVMVVFLAIIAVLSFAFEQCIKIPDFMVMAQKLKSIIPPALCRLGYENKPEDFGPFIDKSIEDYKDLLRHSDVFRKWHRNIYICEFFLVFVISVICFLDLAFLKSNLTQCWAKHRFAIFFNLTSILTYIIVLHAVIDFLQHKLFNCIGLDSSEKNITDKFSLFKQQKLKIGSDLNDITGAP